jgi:predicted Zn-ribbon and HTH transcriptional regulator
MEDSTKKSVMIVVIVVCLAAAAAIIYMNRHGGGGGSGLVSAGNTVWIKCINPDCNAEYEISMKEYQKQFQESNSTSSMGLTPIRCKKCGKDSAYLAEKCPKCGFVFVREMYPPELGDKCPKCGYSPTEAAEKKGRGE